MTAEQLTDLAADKQHRESRTHRLVGASLLGFFAIAVVVKLITDDYTHPMLPVLAGAAGAGAFYLMLKAIRHWHRP